MYSNGKIACGMYSCQLRTFKINSQPMNIFLKIVSLRYAQRGNKITRQLCLPAPSLLLSSSFIRLNAHLHNESTAGDLFAQCLPAMHSLIHTSLHMHVAKERSARAHPLHLSGANPLAKLHGRVCATEWN